MARFGAYWSMGPQSPPPTRRRRRAWPWIVLTLASGALLAAVWIARSRWSVTVDPLARWLEGELAERVEPLRVRRGEVTVRWGGREGPVVVHAERWSLLRSDGELLLAVPEVAIAFDRDSFLRRELRPHWVEARNPRLVLDRDAEGVFLPGRGDLPQTPAEPRDPGAGVLDDWLSQQPSGALSQLEWARLTGGSVEVRDRRLGLTWGAGDLEIGLARERVERVALAGRLVAANAETSLALPFAGAADLGGRRVGLEIAIPQTEAASLAGLHPALARLGGIDVRLGGSATATLGDELIVEPFELTLRSSAAPTDSSAPLATIEGAGRWALDSGTVSVRAQASRVGGQLLASLDPRLAELAPLFPPLAVEVAFDGDRDGAIVRAGARPAVEDGPFTRVTASLRLPPSRRPGVLAVELVGLRPSRLAALASDLEPLAGIEVPFDAVVRGRIGASPPDPLRFELTGRGGTLAVAGVPSPPLAIEEIAIEGEAGGRPESPGVDRATLRIAAGDLDLRGELRRRDHDYAARAEVTAARLERADLDRFWPPERAAEARDRIAALFVDGVLHDVSLLAQLTVDPARERPLRLDALQGAARADGLVLDALPPQPPLSVTARAEFDLDRVLAHVEHARLLDLALGPGTVRLDGLRGDHPRLAIETGWNGPLQSILALLAAEPLSVLRDPDRVAGLAGSSRGELSVETVLGASSSDEGSSAGDSVRDRAQVRAHAEIRDLVWPDGPLGVPISGGPVRVTYGEGRLEVDGETDLASSPARWSLLHRFDQDPRDELQLTARLDPETAVRLGLPERWFVGGTVDLDGTYTGRADGSSAIRADVDLAPARIELAPIGLVKPEGESASARLEAGVDPSGLVTVESLIVDAREIAGAARATARRDPFRIEGADVERLRVGDTELSGSIRRRADDGLSVVVDAARIDLEPLLAARREGATEEDGAAAPRARDATTGAIDSGAGEPEPTKRGIPFDLDLEAGSLRLRSDLATGRVEAAGAWDGERWDRLRVEGAFDDTTRLALDYDRAAARGVVSVEAGDLGNVLVAITDDSQIRGGVLRITGALSPKGDTLTAHAELRSFTLVESPVFTSILTLGTLNTLVELFESRGLEFGKAEADLEWDGRRLFVTKARAVGRGIAFTAAGSFDLEEGTLDLDGTVARMGTAQRIIAKIPGISQLVMGRDRAGVVATRFRLEGAIRDPQIRVEPLSTFTPGFTRDLFGGRRGQAGGKKPEP